jgi:hypothetical protein
LDAPKNFILRNLAHPYLKFEMRDVFFASAHGR